jgi:hypothetical protein
MTISYSRLSFLDRMKWIVDLGTNKIVLMNKLIAMTEI